MIDAAEEAGLLQPGGTIVEPTSGNTGAGLAIVAAQRGYHCIFVMSDKMSDEKVALLRAYGAEVVVCPTAVPPEDPRSYSTAERLVREYAAALPSRPVLQPGQPGRARAHDRARDLGARPWGHHAYFVAGGTGGTITGVGAASRHRTPTCRSSAPTPRARCSRAASGRPYLVEGVGEDFWPTTFDPPARRPRRQVSDADSFLTRPARHV